MIRIDKLTITELSMFKTNVDGSINVPSGMVIYRKETRADFIKRRIAEIEAGLKNIKIPSEKELIEEGKMWHPYYVLNDELNMLKEEK